MTLEVTRLRRGEWIAGISAVVLLIALTTLPWYGYSGSLPLVAPRGFGFGTITGWRALTNMRWLVLVTVCTALALFYFQAARRAPAIPAVLSVLVTVLGLVTFAALLYRVAIDVPTPSYFSNLRYGAIVGLVSAAVLTVGGFDSMRAEGIADRDGPEEIETVRLDRSDGS
jgi:hypothetical protein